MTAQLPVKIWYALRIPPTTRQIEKILLLFERLSERRQLVQMVGVRFSGLVLGRRQLNLFDHTDKEARLLVAMDRVRDTFGNDKVQRVQ